MTNPLATSLLASPSMYNRMATPGLSAGMGSANMPASLYSTGSTAPFDPMALSSPSISSLLGTGAGTSATSLPAMASSVTTSGMTQPQLSGMLQEISTLFKAVMQLVAQTQGQKAQATPLVATTPTVTPAATPAATSSQTPVAATPPPAVTPKTLPAVSNVVAASTDVPTQKANAHDMVYLLKDMVKATTPNLQVQAKEFTTANGGKIALHHQPDGKTILKENGVAQFEFVKDDKFKADNNQEGIGLYQLDAKGNRVGEPIAGPREYFQNYMQERFSGLNGDGDNTIPELVEYLFGSCRPSHGGGGGSSGSSAPASGGASAPTAVNETPSASTSTTTGGASVGGGNTTTPPEATDSSCVPPDSSTVVPLNPPCTAPPDSSTVVPLNPPCTAPPDSSTVVPLNPPSTGCDTKQDPPAKSEEPKKDNVIGQVASVAGAIGGGVVGAGIGAGAGALLALPFPPAAVVTVPAGAVVGALVGGDAGGKLMKAVGNTVGEVGKVVVKTGGNVISDAIDGDFNKVKADLKDGKDKVVKAVKDGWNEVKAVPGKVVDDVKKAVDAINPFK
jgi:hypothetical protein